MNLSHDQKKYIKRHIKNQSVDQMAEKLNTSKKELASYIEKRWGAERLKLVSVNKEPAEAKNWLTKTWLHLLLLVILILITYLMTLNNAFLSDDIAEIRDNPNIGNLSTIKTRPFGFIRLIIYYLALQIGGLNPPLFRLSNILFHIGSTILIYLILLKISRSKKIALFTSALFAVHPAISEAVVWISGGMYTQYTFFFLLAFFFYILSQKSIKYYLLSLLSYLFSFMSHPVMPAGLAVIFLFYEFSFGNLKRNWPKSIGFLVILLAYVFVNLASLGERESTLQAVHYQEKGVDNLFFLLPVALSSYFELIFWPKILTLYHSELFFNAFSFTVRSFLTMVFFFSLGLALFKNRYLFFWLSFFLIALSPTLTPFRLNWIVAERYIYLPSIGIFASFAYFLDKLIQSKKKLSIIFFTVFIVVTTALTIRTMIRNIDWKNEDNLWIATGKTSPSSPNTHNNLGDVYGRWGDKQKALQEFQKAIQLKPNYADAYHNLANTYHELGDDEKALENYQKASSLNPKLWQSLQNIAAIYYQRKKYDQAQDYIQKALQINPKNINLWANLGIIYMTVGEKIRAKEVFTQVLAQDPQNPVARGALMELNK